MIVMLGGWKEMCVRRVIQEMTLHLAHQEVTFSEKTSNQKNQAIKVHTHTHTHAPKSHTKQAEELKGGAFRKQ